MVNADRAHVSTRDLPIVSGGDPQGFLKGVDLGYRQFPRACFGVAADLIRESDDQIQRMLVQQLKARFESTSATKWPFFASWFVRLRLGPGLSFTVALRRSRYKKDEWVLMIGPSEILSPLELIRGQRAKNNSAELLRICREIQVCLTATSGISAVRWYFEGFRGQQTTAVATPDELPWAQT